MLTLLALFLKGVLATILRIERQQDTAYIQCPDPDVQTRAKTGENRGKVKKIEPARSQV
jgi:hypothetical protein